MALSPIDRSLIFFNEVTQIASKAGISRALVTALGQQNILNHLKKEFNDDNRTIRTAARQVVRVNKSLYAKKKGESRVEWAVKEITQLTQLVIKSLNKTEERRVETGAGAGIGAGAGAGAEAETKTRAVVATAIEDVGEPSDASSAAVVSVVPEAKAKVETKSDSVVPLTVVAVRVGAGSGAGAGAGAGAKVVVTGSRDSLSFYEDENTVWLYQLIQEKGVEACGDNTRQTAKLVCELKRAESSLSKRQPVSESIHRNYASVFEGSLPSSYSERLTRWFQVKSPEMKK